MSAYKVPCKLCDGKHQAKGYCQKHYVRLKKYGSPFVVHEHYKYPKGHTTNVGRRLSEETKRKLSEINKGRIFTKEWRRKISLANKGRILSEEWKKKMSIAKLGSKSYNWTGGCVKYWHYRASIIYSEHHTSIICELCGSPNKMDIHHKDKNITNNNLNNLQALCRRCHHKVTNRKLNKKGQFVKGGSQNG